MLTHLEVFGFKSFPDRIRFEFVPGITGIVGPNGSGKSNVVDAIRWVLGEQSARSMRGEGMSDVLFKGSTNRRPAQVAEVTLFLNNRSALYSLDSPEIMVTRRLTRQGQSEYLINGSAVRLRDVKDLFLGSGTGSDSFCVIQQGQVSALLQASPVERRALFEEAAGVSRFKASREESRKKLERVESHLARLGDLKLELDKRVQTARLQAAKAVKFKEIQAQIRDCKINLLVNQWRESLGRIAMLNAKIEALEPASNEEGIGHTGTDIAILQANAANDEMNLKDAEKSRALMSQDLALACQQIQRDYFTLETNAHDQDRTFQRMARAFSRLLAAKSAVEHAKKELDAINSEIRDVVAESKKNEVELKRLEEKAITEKVSVAKTAEANAIIIERRSRIENELSKTQDSIQQTKIQINALVSRKSEAKSNLENENKKFEELVRELEEHTILLNGSRLGLKVELEDRDAIQCSIDHLVRKCNELHVEKSIILGRKDILEGLEKTHEGFGNGVRDILNAASNENACCWKTILGLLADQLKVRRDYAPLIELALDERSQRILALDKADVYECLISLGNKWHGRVGFIFPELAQAEDEDEFIPPPSHPGIIAKASNLVRCDVLRFTDLPERLLGKTLIVKNFKAALEIQKLAPGYSLITLDGDHIDANGDITFGPMVPKSGILSRKAELRELRDRLSFIELSHVDLEKELSTQSAILANCKVRVDLLKNRLETLEDIEKQMVTKVQDSSLAIDGLKTQSESDDHAETELLKALSVLVSETSRLESLKFKLIGIEKEMNDQLADEIRSLNSAEERLKQYEKIRFEFNARLLEKQLFAGQAENRFKERQAFFEMCHLELDKECADALIENEKIQSVNKRMMTILDAISMAHNRYDLLTSTCEFHKKSLDASTQLLNDAVRKESDIAGSKDQLVQQRQMLLIEKAKEELQMSDISRRASEDFQIDLNHESAIRQQETTKPHYSTDLDDLYAQIKRLGSINEIALQELNELVEKQAAFQEQFSDLVFAKKSLLDLIDAANQEGGTQFLTLFNSVSSNFRELFRKLFSGGQAELLLVDSERPLDSGIEVIARPPGKEANNLSLMSGGERTMTAVALLLAVFRARPSPFCVLDEVDAALDEGNVGRFTELIKDFSAKTQFIMITHHKRSMTCADVLLGVTMGDPGISTRMAVRIEDWIPSDYAKAVA